MSEGSPACWICDSTRAQPYKANNGPKRLTAADLRITDDRYGVTLTLARCEDCGFVYADKDEAGDLVELYTQLDDESYEESDDARARQMAWLLEVAMTHHPKAKTALDIGAASGLLVHQAREAGLDAVGVEPSRSLVEAAQRTHGLDLFQGVYPHPELEGRSFDLVFLVDVIEHVVDPLALLRSCEAALEPGGRAIVVTPDLSSPTAKLMGQRWWHLRLAHVGYFGSRSFHEAARRANLQVVKELRAKWFFPIGYLATRVEQYLPVGWFNRIAKRAPGLSWIYKREIPLNLHDSTVFVLERGAA